MSDAFWQTTALKDLTTTQWESLCDGCARCCVHKLEDEDTGDLYYTRVACRLLNSETCRCKEYDSRLQKVSECLSLSIDDIESFKWLPETCAYRLVYEGKPLFSWHPLISGNAESVHKAGISVRGRVISEENVHPDDLQDYIVKWV